MIFGISPERNFNSTLKEKLFVLFNWITAYQKKLIEIIISNAKTGWLYIFLILYDIKITVAVMTDLVILLSSIIIKIW
mgnify:CR=1 FL=1